MRGRKNIRRFLIICVLLSGCGLLVSCLAKSSGEGIKNSSSGKSEKQVALQLTPLVARYVSGRHDFMDIAITSDNELWGVGYDGEDPRRIYYSKDGGSNWEVKQLSTRGFSLNAITFTDAQHGWAVGGNGLILRTTDGGQSWEELQRPTDFDLTRVRFINPQTGYIAGRNWIKDPNNGTETHHVQILRTDDGGQNWKVCYSNDEAGEVFQIAVLSETTAVASIDSSTLIRTEDAGTTWKVVASGKGDFMSVSFTPDATGWAVGNKGSFYRSGDQGRTWQKPDNLPANFSKQNWHSINFADAMTGIAVGENGAVGVTDNGGATWSYYDSQIKENLEKVILRGRTWIVLGSKTVYKGSTR